MITNNYENYDQDGRNLTPDNQMENQQSIGDESRFEQQLLSDNENYTDSEFSNALEQDDQNDLEQDYQENDLEEGIENDNEEEYEDDDYDDEKSTDNIDENSSGTDTFTDDSLKID